MRFNSSDPDIETLYRRITEKLLDLQPDFQRGEVWGLAKQQRLIDTILRGWHVPPIHVIKHDDSHIQEVLDGKQRLTAIRDFMNNEFSVDGYIEPLSPEIQRLDGEKYNELPSDVREDFRRFAIRQFAIDNFSPEEPGELFFRLNNPTYLTAAEQRNAFFGEPRKQIKKLVSIMDEVGIEKDFIGFSNSRMAYDDVLARVCFVFETQTLHKRITSRELSDRYRSSTPFPEKLILQLESVVIEFGKSKKNQKGSFRFNKATLFSWFVFLLSAEKRLGSKIDAGLQAEILFALDNLRDNSIKNNMKSSNQVQSRENVNEEFLDNLFIVFEDRSRARVGNVDSVLVRDIMLWLIFLEKHNSSLTDDKLNRLRKEFKNFANKKNTSVSLAEKFFYDVMSRENWGMEI